MTSDPRKLSEGDRLRAYHDAINAYISMYGAGGDDDGREEFSKSQDAMFIPAEFRGRVYALKVNPMLFRRILLREYREEVAENEEEMKREIREKEKELEEAQKKLDEAKEKAKKEAERTGEVHQDRKNQMMIAQQHRDNALLALGMAGGAISMVQVERMEVDQVKTRSAAKELQQYLQRKKELIARGISKIGSQLEQRLTYSENKSRLEGNEKEPDKIREKRGLGTRYKSMEARKREAWINLLKNNPQLRRAFIAKKERENDGGRSRGYPVS